MPEACLILNPWHVLRVKTGAEQHTATQLELRGVEPFLPSCSVKRQLIHRAVEDVSRALFPGYLFARVGEDQRIAVLRTPGVYEFLRFANHLPATLSDTDIERIRLICNTENVRAAAPIALGQMVEICEGPLEGYTGRVVRLKNACRVYVNIPLFNQAAVTEIDPCRLRVLPEAKPLEAKAAA